MTPLINGQKRFDDVEKCLGEVSAILTAERVRRERREGLAGFVRDLGVE